MSCPYRLTWSALVVGSVLSASSVVAEPQFGRLRESDEAEKEAKQLVVMIDYQLGGEERFGSGIIFGMKNNHLYIATANHVVREGKQEVKEAQNIRVQLKSLPSRSLPAKLLQDRDIKLDLAVISVENFGATGLKVDALPFDRVGDPSSLKRGALLYSLGYPHKRAWTVNVQPDFLSEANDDILYESNFIAIGHSGGALLDGSFDLVGMIRSDQTPYGEAVSILRVLERIREWKYPVNLGEPNEPIKFASVTAGENHACGLTMGGVAYCWGSNAWGALGTGAMPDRLNMKRVVGGLRYQSLSAGRDHTCGVTPAGVAHCWGSNTWGELGNGSQDGSYVPVAVSGGLKFRALSAGQFATCGVTIESVGYCWGSQNRHERVPVRLPGGLSLKSLAVGSTHICGIETEGAVDCWVINPVGHSYSSPAALAGGVTFATISLDAAESSLYCGLTLSGVAYCWGSNRHGELGNGAGRDETTIRNDSDVPVPVSGELTFKLLTVGYGFACGLTTGDAAYCWGLNDHGQLGNGTSNNTNVPVRVSGGLSFVSLSSGRDFACGLVTTGGVYCWGNNDGGQLGNGSRTASPVPVPITLAQSSLSRPQLP